MYPKVFVAALFASAASFAAASPNPRPTPAPEVELELRQNGTPTLSSRDRDSVIDQYGLFFFYLAGDVFSSLTSAGTCNQTLFPLDGPRGLIPVLI